MRTNKIAHVKHILNFLGHLSLNMHFSISFAEAVPIKQALEDRYWKRDRLFCCIHQTLDVRLAKCLQLRFRSLKLRSQRRFLLTRLGASDRDLSSNRGCKQAFTDKPHEKGREHDDRSVEATEITE